MKKFKDELPSLISTVVVITGHFADRTEIILFDCF